MNSVTSITATAPPHKIGKVAVTVTTPYGTSPVKRKFSLQFGDTPTVSSISPTTGPVTGGTEVAVLGTGFTGATAVDFGTVPVLFPTIHSSTSITVFSPAELAGVIDVTVTGPYGTSVINDADQFTYSSSVAGTRATWKGHSAQVRSGSRTTRRIEKRQGRG